MPAAPRFERLEDWLDWQQRLHPSTIDLGLDRVARVLARTGWQRPAVPVVTVGGTNGKGSTVALVAALLRAHAHRVGTFTSPHLLDYRERIQLDGHKVSEAALITAFERIADALAGDSLTYFEFNTLAALLVFEPAGLDAIVLEVGLGGRLDAVNVVDADVAVVVSVALDHMEWLGPDEETIGAEKAGIFRPGRPAIFGSSQPPQALRAVAERMGARLLVRGVDYDAQVLDEATGHWNFVVADEVRLGDLPPPALHGSIQVANAATALMAVEKAGVELNHACAAAGLRAARIAGRLQRVPDARGFEWVLDVAHNPAAAATLEAHLREHPVRGRTLALCGMLGDKDVAGVIARVAPVIDEWYAATTEGPRAIDARELARRALAIGVVMQPIGSVRETMDRVARDARDGDRVVVFGSFHTVGPALAALDVPLYSARDGREGQGQADRRDGARRDRGRARAGVVVRSQIAAWRRCRR